MKNLTVDEYNAIVMEIVDQLEFLFQNIRDIKRKTEIMSIQKILIDIKILTEEIEK